MYDRDDICDSGYEALANGIILQAVKDYRKAIRRFDIYEMGQLRHFFHSQWFSQLTSIDGNVIIKEIERQEIYEKRNVRNAIKKCNKAENR